MTTLPATITASATPALSLESLADRAAGFAGQARAEATHRAYKSDWAHFSAWCKSHDLAARPANPVSIGLYISAYADTLSVATLTRRLSSIAIGHRTAGHQLDTRHPAIRDVMRGLRREKGTAQRQAAAMTTGIVKQVTATCDDTLIGARDKALLLLGVAGALRRSELVALEVKDLDFRAEGICLTIRRSKSDQEGVGRVIAIGRGNHGTCPVLAVKVWLAVAALTEGRVFRSINRHGQIGAALSSRSVAAIVQDRAGRAGLDALVFSGHSMRAGFATSAAEARVEERDIARQTGHASMLTLRRYIRDGELFSANLTSRIGL